MYIIVDDIVVEVADAGGATVTALDGTDDSFSPVSLSDVTSDIRSLNVETVLLSGDLAVTLVGDELGSGTFKFLFTDDTSAAGAIALLRRPTSFSLAVPDRPTLNRSFVRNGTLSPAIHSELRDVWEFSVGYREVSS